MKTTIVAIRSILESSEMISLVLSSVLGDAKLTIREYSILYFLYENGRSSMKELSENTIYTYKTMTYFVSRLDRRDLIERTASEQDRRVMLVHLTDLARSTMDQLVPIMNKSVDQILEDLDQASLHQLIDRQQSIFARALEQKEKSIDC